MTSSDVGAWTGNCAGFALSGCTMTLWDGEIEILRKEEWLSAVCRDAQ
jgi:hypothetical protein